MNTNNHSPIVGQANSEMFDNLQARCNGAQAAAQGGQGVNGGDSVNAAPAPAQVAQLRGVQHESKDDWFSRVEQHAVPIQPVAPEVAERAIRMLQETLSKDISFKLGASITEEEWCSAKITPICIVEDWFFEDVGVFYAPGGTGKTTLILFQAIHVILGLPLFGYQVYNPGPVVLITAEDSRESLVARASAICYQLNLSDSQVAEVRRDLIITDVAGRGFKLTTVEREAVVPSAQAEALAKAVADVCPSLVVIDPAVSFGIGESRVNDSEQGLIDAARLIRDTAKCCVLYIHHTGKANSREKTLDQYSGRGGSAFSDGSRMVHVMQTVNTQDWLAATGEELEAGESGLVLARPKMSHARPQPYIYIKRKGYNFIKVEHHADEAVALNASAEKIWEFLNSEITQGRRYSQNTLMEQKLLPQAATRAAVKYLLEEGRVEVTKFDGTGRGGARQYLRPIASLEL